MSKARFSIIVDRETSQVSSSNTGRSATWESLRQRPGPAPERRDDAQLGVVLTARRRKAVDQLRVDPLRGHDQPVGCRGETVELVVVDGRGGTGCASPTSDRCMSRNSSSLRRDGGGERARCPG